MFSDESKTWTLQFVNTNWWISIYFMCIPHACSKISSPFLNIYRTIRCLPTWMHVAHYAWSQYNHDGFRFVNFEYVRNPEYNLPSSQQHVGREEKSETLFVWSSRTVYSKQLINLDINHSKQAHRYFMADQTFQMATIKLHLQPKHEQFLDSPIQIHLWLMTHWNFGEALIAPCN